MGGYLPKSSLIHSRSPAPHSCSLCIGQNKSHGQAWLQRVWSKILPGKNKCIFGEQHYKLTAQGGGPHILSSRIVWYKSTLPFKDPSEFRVSLTFDDTNPLALSVFSLSEKPCDLAMLYVLSFFVLFLQVREKICPFWLCRASILLSFCNKYWHSHLPL